MGSVQFLWLLHFHTHPSSPSSNGVRTQSQVQSSIVKKADAFYWWTILLSTTSQTEKESNVKELA